MGNDGKTGGKSLFSIRMRASKTLLMDRKNKGASTEYHISGAEGLYPENHIKTAVGAYVKRALSHPRGKPDRVVLTIERLDENPIPIASLSVTTLSCVSVKEAKRSIRGLLKKSGISTKAATSALRLLYSTSVMRGASLIDSATGERLEPDHERGVRVSRIGTGAAASRRLSAELGRYGLSGDTVKEALLIASKAASCNRVIAEVCISDDPDYTIGYFSSPKTGYVRIRNIKTEGSKAGGRVFFIRDNSDIKPIIAYLEKTPALITSISPCNGTTTPDEFIRSHNI